MIYLSDIGQVCVGEIGGGLFDHWFYMDAFKLDSGKGMNV